MEVANLRQATKSMGAAVLHEMQWRCILYIYGVFVVILILECVVILISDIGAKDVWVHP